MKKIGILIIIIILAVVVIAGYVRIKNKRGSAFYNFIIVENSNLVQEVNVTGRVQPAESVDLAFETSGKVNNVYVKIGDQVKAGQVLVRLDSSTLAAQLSQYQAALNTQQAKLDELKKGTRPEELQVAERKVQNAQNSLEDAETNFENVQEKAEVDLANLYDDAPDILNDSYTKADYAIITQIDDLFSNDNSVNPQLTFTTTNTQAKIDIEQQRVVIGNELTDFKTETGEVSSLSSFDVLDQTILRADNHLITIRDFLIRLNDALNGAVNISATTLSTYKTNLNTARTNINTAITNISTQKQALAAQRITNQNNIATAQTAVNSAGDALILTRNELSLKQAGAATEQIVAQEAQVEQARATIENIQVQIVKTVLQAPINGLVTQQQAKRGEIISANQIVISLISEVNFEIEANIPEADIAKVKIANSAEITLDAYGDEIWLAEVIEISPAETMIEGIATYKVTLQFEQEDGRIKSGMTADVDILTGQRENVIVIPQRAIITRNDQKFVRIIEGEGRGEEFKEVAVELGLRGSVGEIEIIKGLKEGDKVITFLKETE